MDTQLSRFMRSMTARPCRSSFAPFDGTISSERIAHTACSRRSPAPRLTSVYSCLMVWWQSGVLVGCTARLTHTLGGASAVMLTEQAWKQTQATWITQIGPV